MFRMPSGRIGEIFIGDGAVKTPLVLKRWKREYGIKLIIDQLLRRKMDGQLFFKLPK